MKKLLCGFAQADITPQPETVYLDGYGHRVSPATGVKDPLYAKVCVMQSGEDLFVIAALDVCGLCNELKDRLRNRVKVLTNLRDNQLALCATHTHSAPACGVLEGLPINWLYWDHVGDCIVQAVENALSRLCEGHFRFAFGEELLHAGNRRGREIIDRRLPVCAFYDSADTLRGVIAGASCHAVCNMDMELSADYPSVLTREAKKRYPGVPFLFLQGRGADINPYIDKDEDGLSSLEILGREFSRKVLTTLEHMGDGAAEYEGIRSLYRTVRIPMCYPTRQELTAGVADIRRQLQHPTPQTDHRYLNVDLEWHRRALKAVEQGISPFLEADFEMAVIGGEWVFAFVPFELLTPTGNAIEAILARYGIAPDKCFVIGYSNGTNGYLAVSAESLTPGYETGGASHWYGLPLCCADSEKTVLQTFAELAEELLGK